MCRLYKVTVLQGLREATYPVGARSATEAEEIIRFRLQGKGLLFFIVLSVKKG